MEVGVRVEAENMITGHRRHTNTCYLTFVAIDGDGKPTVIPEVQPISEDEIRRFEAAQARRKRRLEERQQEDRDKR
jgi:acyl-CoA hydrolase